MMKSKTKVLLIDDEPAFTSLLRANLEDTGRYRVRQENDSRRALASAREFGPDIILLDVSMPDMDGGDVTSQLRNDAATSGVPIIFVTALVDREEVPLGGTVSAGHRFLPKPVAVAEVIDCIDAELKNSQHRCS